jgi:hypothetical protein
MDAGKELWEACEKELRKDADKRMIEFLYTKIVTPERNPFFDDIRDLIGQGGLDKYYDWVVKEVGGKENFSFFSTSNYWGVDSSHFKRYLEEIK